VYADISIGGFYHACGAPVFLDARIDTVEYTVHDDGDEEVCLKVRSGGKLSVSLVI
jgi:hypothetical protein